MRGCCYCMCVGESNAVSVWLMCVFPFPWSKASVSLLIKRTTHSSETHLTDFCITYLFCIQYNDTWKQLCIRSFLFFYNALLKWLVANYYYLLSLQTIAWFFFVMHVVGCLRLCAIKSSHYFSNGLRFEGCKT